TVSNVNGTDSIESIITVTEAPVLPVANFSSNVTSGFVPLSVQFTDSSENATAWNWDFGDGNSSADQNPLHIFSTAGTYTVNLTVSNVNGTDSKTTDITVSDYIYDYCIEKTVLDVSGNGSSANITKAGDIVRYEVCVENKGNIDLTSISVNDSLINLTGPFETLNTNGILEVEEHWHYTGNYTVTQEDLNNNGGGNGFINNTATVDCAELTAKSDSALVPIEQNPACSIKKYVLDIAGNGPQGNISSAGDVIQFRVNMTNNGNIDLTNISVRDSLLNLSGPFGDIGLFGLYQSSLAQYTSSGDGILSVGETWYYLGNYTVTQEDLNNNGGGDGFLNSTVTLESSETGPINESTIQYIDENGNETGSVSPGIHIEHNPSCSFSKSVIEVVNGDNDTVDDSGDIIRYSILAINDGNVELTGVTVSDPLIPLTGPVESLHADGILELGENWTYTGNYTVTEDDMDNEGGGDEDIDNTATLSCNELSNKTSSVEVELIIPESSGGSSHSSGGSGGSPEPSTNIEVKEISQAFVTNGKTVQFDFTKNATCVVYVGFDSKKTAGKITTIAEQLKKKSTLVSNLTEGKVYKYFNVWVGNSGFVSSDNMENMNICFKVSKSWLQNENIDQDSITLNRYNNKIWVQLPVSLLKEDSKYLYFTADVPGYSFFAITGKSNASGGSVTEIKPDESESVEENTGNNNVKPETTDEENTGESGSKFGILSLIAFLLIACLAVVFLYFKGQENQK
ncbi:PGF-pre-PGF domain-containing protein, partial [Methanosarcina sp.]|uniref:PGF-pre-PGF domain-containing protein n=1 Tax=Methanosarcina sp. TaxID=2213 RepID=UPI002C9082E8